MHEIKSLVSNSDDVCTIYITLVIDIIITTHVYSYKVSW